MAQVVANGNGTYTLTLTAKETRAVTRNGAEQSPAQSPAKVLQNVIGTQVQGWIDDQYASDGPVRLQKFAGLTVNKQDAVDALLNGG